MGFQGNPGKGDTKVLRLQGETWRWRKGIWGESRIFFHLKQERR
jgi:hypothetical protein